MTVGHPVVSVSRISYNAAMGEAQLQTIEMYVTPTGRVPFEEWVRGLHDARARGRIRARLARVRLGNFGDAHAVGGGIWELRIDYGPDWLA